MAEDFTSKWSEIVYKPLRLYNCLTETLPYKTKEYSCICSLIGALGEILFVPQYRKANGLLDAESVAKESRALWLYATDQSYRDEVKARREYYLINTIVEKIIDKERRPMYQQQARIRQQLEERIFQTAHIILPSYEGNRKPKRVPIRSAKN